LNLWTLEYEKEVLKKSTTRFGVPQEKEKEEEEINYVQKNRKHNDKTRSYGTPLNNNIS
jgi:hypothetical protein